MSELNFIWPPMWQGLTMQPLFCYIFKRSGAGDWLFLLTTLHSLSPPWKRAKCSPRQSKISKIPRGSMSSDPPTSLYLHCPNAPPPHEKSLLRACTFSNCISISNKSWMAVRIRKLVAHSKPSQRNGKFSQIVREKFRDYLAARNLTLLGVTGWGWSLINRERPLPVVL